MTLKELLPGAVGAMAGDLATVHLPVSLDVAGLPGRRIAATMGGVWAGEKLQGGSIPSWKTIAIKTALAYFGADISEMAYGKVFGPTGLNQPAALQFIRPARWAGAGFAATLAGKVAPVVAAVVPG